MTHMPTRCVDGMLARHDAELAEGYRRMQPEDRAYLLATSVLHGIDPANPVQRELARMVKEDHS